MTPEERFWATVEKTDDCWLWTGSQASRGYGQTWLVGNSRMYAHRAAFQLEHGRAPVGSVLHRCGNPLCVRPSHLYEGDHRQNAADYIRHGGTAWHGEENRRAKLTEVEVKEMRRAYAVGNVSQTALAKRFGVTRAAAHLILTRQRWTHLK